MSFEHENETALLGTLLVSQVPMVAVDLEQGLRPGHFRSQAHAEIYRGMRWLYSADDSFDRVSLRSFLSQQGKLSDDVADVLDRLAAAPVAVGNVRRYATNVMVAAKRRAGIDTATRLLEQLHGGGDVDQALEQAEVGFLDLAHGAGQKHFEHIGDLLSVEQERIQAVASGQLADDAIPTGFTDVDVLLGGDDKTRTGGGVRPGQLVIVAGRPAMGKSAFVTAIAENVAVAGHTVALFSLEMGGSQIARRMISSRTRIPSDRLRTGEVMPNQWQRIVDKNAELARSPLYVDDTSDLSIAEIRAKARRLHARSPIRVLVVDYLQLIRMEQGPGVNRTQAVAEVTRGLKLLANELQCTVIALSQLSRNLESRMDKRPLLSDLRESGAIEQDADVVVFLYRDEYYDKDTSDRDIAEVIVGKNRDGALGTAKVVFDAPYTRFSNQGRARTAA